MNEGLIKQARARAMKYCSLAERSTHQVEEKLLSYGLTIEAALKIIEELRSENYINEERFAKAFCHDKFELNHWGRQKIKNEIQRYRIDNLTLQKGLDAIDEAKYEETLQRLLRKKWDSLAAKELPHQMRELKTLNFGVGRGFEPNLIWPIIRQLSH